MTPQDPDRILAHALGIEWDGPDTPPTPRQSLAIPQSTGLPPAPWTARDRWWIKVAERWITGAQAWYQRSEYWRRRAGRWRDCFWLTLAILALTWAWILALGVREWVG